MKQTNKQANKQRLSFNFFQFGFVLFLISFCIAATPPKQQTKTAVCSSFNFSSQVDCSGIEIEFRQISTGDKIDITGVTPLVLTSLPSYARGTILYPGA